MEVFVLQIYEISVLFFGYAQSKLFHIFWKYFNPGAIMFSYRPWR